MTIETGNPGPSREQARGNEQEIADLIRKLRGLAIAYWLPGLDSGGKGDVEREEAQICDRLIELGVDPETIPFQEPSDSV